MNAHIQPLPVHVPAFHGEVVPSYAPRAAAANASDVKDTEDVERARGTLVGKGRDTPSRRALWRALGRLPETAFTEPQSVAGNWVAERALCEVCTTPEKAWGRLWDIGYACAEHTVWLPTGTRVVDAPWLSEAETTWRNVLTPRGVTVDCPAARLVFEAAQVGIAKSTLASRAGATGLDPVVEWEALVYPEAVALTDVLTRAEFADTHTSDLPGRDRRAQVVHAVHKVLPDVGDAETWRAVARVWDCALSLHRAATTARVLGQPIQEPWNLAQYRSEEQDVRPRG